MISLNKLEKVAHIAFENALRLHFDAIHLYKDGRYPSAFYLSILSQEEIGKMHIINDFVWRARTERKEDRDSEFEEKWLSLMYKHPHKQATFLRQSSLSRLNEKSIQLMETVWNGTLEEKKQGSVYARLKRHNGKIDLDGRIKHPFQIKRIVAQKQITMINDFLLVSGLKIRYEQISWDNEVVEKTISNKKLLGSISKYWRIKSHSAKVWIKVMQKFSGETIVGL